MQLCPSGIPHSDAGQYKRTSQQYQTVGFKEASPHLDCSGWPALSGVHALAVLWQDKLFLGLDNLFLGSHLHT